MKYDNSLHNNPIIEPIPLGNQPSPPTIQSVLYETRQTLMEIEAELENIRKFIRFDQGNETAKDFDVKDMETDIHTQRDIANRILKKTVEIIQLLGR